MMLKLDQISCRYGQVEVLHQVSLQLEQGEILGLLGRNGAGKTTLLKCLMGLLPLVSGNQWKAVSYTHLTLPTNREV